MGTGREGVLAAAPTAWARDSGVLEPWGGLPPPLASAPSAAPAVRRALVAGVSLVAVASLSLVEAGRRRLRVGLAVLRTVLSLLVPLLVAVVERAVVVSLLVVVEGAAVGGPPPTAAPMVVRASAAAAATSL